MNFLKDWLPILIAAAALVYNGMEFRKAATKDTYSEAKEMALMSAGIAQIREDVKDIKRDMRSCKDDISDLQIRMTKLETHVDAISNRLAQLEEREGVK